MGSLADSTFIFSATSIDVFVLMRFFTRVYGRQVLQQFIFLFPADFSSFFDNHLFLVGAEVIINSNSYFRALVCKKVLKVVKRIFGQVLMTK